MGSLDRLLELEHRTLNHITSESNSFLKPDEEQEYQSLKSQIEKALEYSDKWIGISNWFGKDKDDSLIPIIDYFVKNQKSPQDVVNQEIVDRLKEEIKNFNEYDINDKYHVYEVESLLQKILDGGEK